MMMNIPILTHLLKKKNNKTLLLKPIETTFKDIPKKSIDQKMKHKIRTR